MPYRNRSTRISRADTVPDHNRHTTGVDDVTLRLSNIVVVKPGDEARAAALNYLTRTGNTDVAECLGLTT